jgi:hypothetical protein
MITKSDWQAVHQRMSAEDRRKLGEPPAIEEMLAYTRGELSGADAERVRAWLVCNPDEARALTEPFPEDDVQPGHPDFLSQDELTQRFAPLQTRGRVVPFRPAWTALAAALALVFAGLYGQAEWKLRRLSGTPQNVQTYTLVSAQQRGTPQDASTRVERCTGDFLTFVMPVTDAGFGSYRITIAEITTASPRKRESLAGRGNEELVSVLVPCSFLKPGRYDIALYGLTGTGAEERLDRYKVRVGR